jgi:hypothetical protein
VPITIFEPFVRGRRVSNPNISKDIVVNDNIRSLSLKGIISVIPFIKFITALLGMVTPLGFPVEPDV